MHMNKKHKDLKGTPKFKEVEETINSMPDAD